MHTLTQWPKELKKRSKKQLLQQSRKKMKVSRTLFRGIINKKPTDDQEDEQDVEPEEIPRGGKGKGKGGKGKGKGKGKGGKEKKTVISDRVMRGSTQMKTAEAEDRKQDQLDRRQERQKVSIFFTIFFNQRFSKLRDRESRKKRRVHQMSQRDILEEAKFTEIQNLKDLEYLTRLEEEKKKIPSTRKPIIGNNNL